MILVLLYFPYLYLYPIYQYIQTNIAANPTPSATTNTIPTRTPYPITNIFLISTPSSTDIFTLNEISPTCTPNTKIALTTTFNPITNIAPTNIIFTPPPIASTATNYIVTYITPTTTDITNNIVLQDQQFFSYYY